MNKGADFSQCRTWRYRLWRIWDSSKPYAMFLMLNPSTADENKNDPTVERCQRYAQAWGYGGLYVCNIFAYRATDPAIMKTAADPVGPENDDYIWNTANDAGIVVCAWGNHGIWLDRSKQVRELLSCSRNKLHCLKVTGAGEPGHPLYLKKSLQPILFDQQGNR
ncbi:MAG: DUF1643 domain-containing protein [Chloroflexota bacterium]|nr:DUF1643 domain-containing protein [Chloroflexota bacterium]